MIDRKVTIRNAWAWVPSLYYLEGLPYIIINSVSVLVYKSMGLSNTDIALYTSWLYLPWVIKPFWAPLVDFFKTKRFWIVTMQFIMGAGLAGIGLTIPAGDFFKYTMIIFFLMAFSSATHDIAADGFYMIGLSEHDQAFFVGIRSTFYRIAMLTAQGFAVMIAGYFERHTGSIGNAWALTFWILTAVFLIVTLYHMFILPYPVNDKRAENKGSKNFFLNYFRTFALFFKKKHIILIICFLLVYRFGEAQLIKIAQPFLKDPRGVGGLGLSLSEIGFAYGTVGLIALMLGGIAGGLLTSRDGLKKWIWWMFAAINLPHILYILLAFMQPDNMVVITLCIAGEQFGYGFGFTAYMLYMIYISEGEFKTSHYALCTGFMALSMMLPGMFAGWIQEQLGYQHFFIWVLLTMVPGFIILKFLPLDASFGKKKAGIGSKE